VPRLGCHGPLDRSIEIGVGEDHKKSLAPNSMTVLRTRSAACSSCTQPTSVEPVNDTMRTAW
jgi:hypothetical protein